LGAGFTRAVVGEKAPLTYEIMPTLDLSNFPEVREDFEKTFPDIEQFLTVLDLKILRFMKANKSIAERLSEIRQDIVAQVVRRVGPDSLCIHRLDDYPALSRFIDSMSDGTKILSLNYDCVLDQGLYLSGRWSPFGGYSYTNFPHGDNENDALGRIKLLKLHGSCNFKDTEHGQQYFTIEASDSVFPGIHAHINTGEGSPHILIMTYIKQFHNGIMSLWRQAISALMNAERLVIVGCSLREEDTFLRFALYHFGMKQNTKCFYIDIVDISSKSCREILDKIRGLVANPDLMESLRYDSGLSSYLIRT
jgi:hypothetical protein